MTTYLEKHPIRWEYRPDTGLWHGFGANAVGRLELPGEGLWAILAWPTRLVDVRLHNTRLKLEAKYSAFYRNQAPSVPPVLGFRLVPTRSQPAAVEGTLCCQPSYLLINTPAWAGGPLGDGA